MVRVKDRLRQHEITRPEDGPGATGSWNCSVATFECSLYVSRRYFYFISFAESSLKASRRIKGAGHAEESQKKRDKGLNSFRLIAAFDPYISPIIKSIV